MSEIYLVRHGETVFNMKGRYQGQLDSPLTEYGVEQVSDVAHMLRVTVHDMSRMKVISSPLGRTLQTAQIICNTLGYDFSKVDIDDRLTEVSLGSWDGLTISEIEEQFPGALANTNQYSKRPKMLSSVTRGCAIAAVVSPVMIKMIMLSRPCKT